MLHRNNLQILKTFNSRHVLCQAQKVNYHHKLLIPKVLKEKKTITVHLTQYNAKFLKKSAQLEVS